MIRVSTPPLICQTTLGSHATSHDEIQGGGRIPQTTTPTTISRCFCFSRLREVLGSKEQGVRLPNSPNLGNV